MRLIVSKSKLKARLLLVACIVAYAVAFDWTYRDYVVPVFDYFGCSYAPPPLPYQIVSWIAILIPALWLPMRLRRPSQLFFYVQYIVVFIPMAFMVYHSSRPVVPRNEALILVLLGLAGLSVIQCVYYLPLGRFRAIHLKASQMWWMVYVCLLAVVIYVFAVFGHGMRLTMDFDSEMMALRQDSNETATGSLLGFRLTGYLTGWTQSLVLPFLMAVGLFSRRWWLVAGAGALYWLFFIVQGTKTAALAPLFPLLVYYWVNGKGENEAARFTKGLAFLVALPIPLAAMNMTKAVSWLAFFLHFRCLAGVQLLFCQYYEFFKHNPLTHMAHVTGLNLLIHDPYPEGSARIPFMVSYYIYGKSYCSNAGMWAWDGLGGFGPAGIVIISVAAAVLYWILDSAAVRLKPRFVAVMLAYMVGAVMNVPICTTLVTHGLGLFILSLPLLPKVGILRCAFRETRPVQPAPRQPGESSSTALRPARAGEAPA